MIISRTPVRVPLGGGGTDLPAYYQNYGGALSTAAVNKYVFILVKDHFEDTVRFSGYYNKEVVASADQITHPVVSKVLQLLEIEQPVEIVSVSDVPASVGLGTSSSFTVGLLNALHTFRGENCSPDSLAKEALAIERVMLNEPGGVQDQYIAAYGGLIALDINTAGDVAVTPLGLAPEVIANLESNLLFFYTNVQREAMEIQSQHVESIKKGQESVLASLHEIKRIGFASKEALKAGELDRFGCLLDEHWNFKRNVGDNVSTKEIDKWYKLAMGSGALGGKLMGAGGGGFLMFYCPTQKKDCVRATLAQQGLKEIYIRFEPGGSKIILNI